MIVICKITSNLEDNHWTALYKIKLQKKKLVIFDYKLNMGCCILYSLEIFRIIRLYILRDIRTECLTIQKWIDHLRDQGRTARFSLPNRRGFPRGNSRRGIILQCPRDVIYDPSRVDVMQMRDKLPRAIVLFPRAWIARADDDDVSTWIISASLDRRGRYAKAYLSLSSLGYTQAI